jgi:predicted RNA-binding Zn-ribbon protein involved in translation (DUF1610 family)
MPRATCRCGHPLDVPNDGTERIVCPNCGANVRIRRPGAKSTSIEENGFVRFSCPCGRRLKVALVGGSRPTHGKCPDCGRVVPVPASQEVTQRDTEAPTAELSPEDALKIAQWSKKHTDPHGNGESAEQPIPQKSEAGLRVCPGCGKPVHLGAIVCRSCGSHVPKK